MALTVEDGTGVAAADSYESLAAVNAFHAARGNVQWAQALDWEKEQALRRAADYLDVWHVRGDRLLPTQGLAWPFADSENIDEELRQLRRAVALLAPIALGGDLVARAPDDPQVLSATDKVGDLSESRTYADMSDSVTMLAGIDVSFLSRVLPSFTGAGGGIVLGSRVRG